jgi:Na+-driven multidrug efflux pump
VKDQIGSAKSQEKIFKVALPVSLEAIFQTSLGFVDQIIVGTLGATAVAAVGLCNSITFIVMLLYSAIGTGAGVLVAQAFGRDDLNDVSKVASLSLSVSMTLIPVNPKNFYEATGGRGGQAAEQYLSSRFAK